MITEIERVIQEDPTGCGIACIAMLVKEPYSYVKKILLKNYFFENSNVFYTNSSDLRIGMEIFGIKSKKARAIKYWSTIKDLSIVAINYSEKSNTWHWVIYVPDNVGKYDYVIDPKKSIKTLKRTDFKKMKLKLYIPIVP